jgi:hypothetical protein
VYFPWLVKHSHTLKEISIMIYCAAKVFTCYKIQTNSIPLYYHYHATIHYLRNKNRNNRVMVGSFKDFFNLCISIKSVSKIFMHFLLSRVLFAIFTINTYKMATDLLAYYCSQNSPLSLCNYPCNFNQLSHFIAYN